jgi:predicted enzyme related to lactoylglutathione lyase
MATEARLIVNIDVDDLPRAEAFYRSVFGLTPGRRFGYSGVELIGLPAPIWLLLKDADHAIAPGSGQGRSYDRHWTPVHLDIAVDDLDAAVSRAVTAGAVQEGETREAAWGSIAMFADPFGHGFCLIQFSAAGYDAVAD